MCYPISLNKLIALCQLEPVFIFAAKNLAHRDTNIQSGLAIFSVDSRENMYLVSWTS